MMTLPLPNVLSVVQHTLYKHPEYGDRESVGCWRRDEGWGPSELPHPTAPRDTAMVVTSRSCLSY